MRATRSATALMTTENVHVLRRSSAVARLLLADSNSAESAIALRALKRRSPGFEIWPVTTLAEAAEVLAHKPIEIALVGSGLDGRTLPQTLRWLARNARQTAIVAMVERLDDRGRQEALEAGASHVVSKPGLLATQLRHELASRLGSLAAERPRRMV